MKKNLVIILVCLTTIISAQNPTTMQEIQAASNALGSAGISSDMKAYNRVYLNSTTNQLEIAYDDIEGSPFLQKSFSKTKIDGITEAQSMRYNIYADQLEIEKNGEIMVFPKYSSYTRFVFPSSNEIIQFFDTKDENTGYFLELANAKTKIYKKLKIQFSQGSSAISGYQEAKEPQFSKGDPIYYIKTADDTIIKNPKSNKDILSIYSTESQRLNDYFKKNRIKYTNDNDLKKLALFLDTL